MEIFRNGRFELVVLLVREGDERDALALERSGIMLRIPVEELPLIVALDDALVRGPEVAARVFS